MGLKDEQGPWHLARVGPYEDDDHEAARYRFELLKPTTLWWMDGNFIRGWWVRTTAELMLAWNNLRHLGISNLSVKQDIMGTATQNPDIIRVIEVLYD